MDRADEGGSPAASPPKARDGSRLRLSQAFAISAPSVPLGGLALPLVVYLPPFYAAVVGVDLALAGTIFMLVRFSDVIFDPVFGVISDRTRSRFGRRRPYLALSAPILMLAVWQLFFPPQGAGALHLTGWLILLYIGWTFATLSQVSWISELTPDYHDRSRLQGLVHMVGTSGAVAILALPALVEMIEGPGIARAMGAMGGFVMALLPITIGWAVWAVPEPAPRVHRHAELWTAFHLIRRNAALRRILICDLCSGVAGGVTGALFVFFAADVMKLAKGASVLLLIYFMVGVAAIPLWVRFSARFGKHRTLATGSGYTILVLPFLLALPQGQLWAGIAGFIVTGIAFGVAGFALRAMMSDVVDEDELENGEARTGLFFALLALTNKVGVALSVGIAYPLLDLVGYKAQGGNSDGAINGMALVFIGVPVAAHLITMWAMKGYPLTEDRQRAVHQAITERHQAAAAG